MTPLTQDERLNRCAEYHGRPLTEREKQRVLQSMIDHLDYLDGLQPLRREVQTQSEHNDRLYDGRVQLIRLSLLSGSLTFFLYMVLS